MAGPSPFDLAWRHRPRPEHAAIRAELGRLTAEHPSDFLYLQNALGPYVNRTEQTQLPPSAARPVRPGALLVLCPGLDAWGVEDFPRLLRDLERSPSRFEKLPGFQRLRVFRAREPEPRSERNPAP